MLEHKYHLMIFLQVIEVQGRKGIYPLSNTGSKGRPKLRPLWFLSIGANDKEQSLCCQGQQRGSGFLCSLIMVKYVLRV